MATLVSNASTDMWADIYNLMLQNRNSPPTSTDYSSFISYQGVTFF